MQRKRAAAGLDHPQFDLWHKTALGLEEEQVPGIEEMGDTAKDENMCPYALEMGRQQLEPMPHP